MKKIIKARAAFLVLLVTLAVYVAGCGSKESQLIGQWEVVESNVDVNFIPDKIEFFNDGTATGVLIGLGWSFTWRIDNDRLTLILAGGAVQIYSIAEISKSTLILEGNSGNVRIKYSKKSSS